MKPSIIAAVLLIIVTIIGSFLGTSHLKAASIIAPTVGSLVSICLYFVFMKWEEKLTK
ncbi:hypothetical protein ACE1TI_05490 [Alteribacillus sp. JSM 102045]|uniref:hypothetical protein n=1 Tax=Alteribacillus sp. JSM 102045 TaxID=1562101 RepID=UPI0035C01085